MKRIYTPITAETITSLEIGEPIYICGTIYTARDAAHKKMLEHLETTGEMLLAGEVIYYAGPCPAKPNEPIGSIGPTSSYRMDLYTPLFINHGCNATIGKGKRSEETENAIRFGGAVHFEAIGGAGAYYKNCVRKATLLYFPELKAEAVYELEVEDFPVIVGIK